MITKYVKVEKMQLIWNGKLTGDFVPSRGLRQRDLLSPYLFVLCIKKLSHDVFKHVLARKWKALKVSKNGQATTHLIFADNLIIFSEACSYHVQLY